MPEHTGDTCLYVTTVSLIRVVAFRTAPPIGRLSCIKCVNFASVGLQRTNNKSDYRNFRFINNFNARDRSKTDLPVLYAYVSFLISRLNKLKFCKPT